MMTGGGSLNECREEDEEKCTTTPTNMQVDVRTIQRTMPKNHVRMNAKQNQNMR